MQLLLHVIILENNNQQTVSTTTVVNTLNSTSNILQGIAAYKQGDMIGAYNALKKSFSSFNKFRNLLYIFKCSSKFK